MGVEKLFAGEFAAVFGIISISFLLSLENVTMGTVFRLRKEYHTAKDEKTEDEDTKDSAKRHFVKFFYKTTLHSLCNFLWYAALSTCVSAFIVFYLDYNSLTISNEDNNDFYVVAVMYSMLFAGLKLLPHIFLCRYYKESTMSIVWVVFSAVYNLGFSMALTVLYFLHEENTSGSLQVVFTVLLGVTYAYLGRPLNAKQWWPLNW